MGRSVTGTLFDVDGTLVDRKASVPYIGLLSGGISRDELTTAGAAQVCAGPGDLLAAFGRSLLAERSAD